MKGIDLKLTAEIATKRLGQEVEDAISRIRSTGEDLAVQLSNASAAIKPIDVAKAEVAAYIDFVQAYYLSTRTQLNLNFNGSSWSYVDLHNGFRPGRYRALILIERLGDVNEK